MLPKKNFPQTALILWRINFITHYFHDSLISCNNVNIMRKFDDSFREPLVWFAALNKRYQGFATGFEAA